MTRKLQTLYQTPWIPPLTVCLVYAIKHFVFSQATCAYSLRQHCPVTRLYFWPQLLKEWVTLLQWIYHHPVDKTSVSAAFLLSSLRRTGACTHWHDQEVQSVWNTVHALWMSEHSKRCIVQITLLSTLWVHTYSVAYSTFSDSTNGKTKQTHVSQK